LWRPVTWKEPPGIPPARPPTSQPDGHGSTALPHGQFSRIGRWSGRSGVRSVPVGRSASSRVRAAPRTRGSDLCTPHQSAAWPARHLTLTPRPRRRDCRHGHPAARGRMPDDPGAGVQPPGSSSRVTVPPQRPDHVPRGAPEHKRCTVAWTGGSPDFSVHATVVVTALGVSRGRSRKGLRRTLVAAGWAALAGGG
jgi:hypothetical protein